MAVTIGSNYVRTNSGNINMYRSSNNALNITNVGKQGQYPAFNASTNDTNWRYGGQLGGVSNWRETATWGAVRNRWVVQQKAQGSYGFDTDTGRYYAPVSGYYNFGITAYYGCESQNSQGYSHWNFRRNGQVNFNGGRHGHAIFGHDVMNYHVDGLQIENLTYLNTGEWMAPAPYWGACGRNGTYMGHFTWWGYLMA